MSEELTDHKRKLQQKNDKIDSAYRTVFAVKGVSEGALNAARKVLIQDLDDIIYQRNYRADKGGNYCPYKAAVEDGFRLLAKEQRKRINSDPMGSGRKKIKVEKA